MYERFTERARKVMHLANQEAQRFNHEFIGTEHILLALVREGSGVAAQVIRKFHIDLRQVRLEVEKLIRSGPDMITIGKLPMTPAAKRVVKHAAEESEKLGQDHIGTEHLLLGLLREEESVAAQVLMNLGLRLDKIRKVIENALQQPAEQADKPPASQTTAVPQTCPKCGQPVVRVVWGYAHLFGKNLEDISTGRAILAPVAELGGPSWVCLNCAPKWSEVHGLVIRSYELQVEKEKAVAAMDFAKAAQCRDAQVGLLRQAELMFEELAKAK
jgi:hypothetical protein